MRAITAFLIGIAVFLMALKPVRSPDVWHHIASGQHVAQSGPAGTDPFSFTAKGKKWVQYEWLAQLLIYKTFKVPMIAPLVIFRAAAMAIAAVFLFYASMAGGARAPTAAAAVALAMLAASGRFFSRPEIFSFLLICMLLYLDQLLRQWKRWPIGAVFVIFALWVNLHGAWPAGLALLGLLAGGETITWFRRGGKGKFPTLIWVAFGAALPATLCNPYTWEIWTVPFKLVGAPEVREYIQEWQRPGFGFFLRPAAVGGWLFLVSFIVLPKKLSMRDWLVIGFFGLLSLTAKRHLATAMIIVAPVAAVQFGAIADRVSQMRIGRFLKPRFRVLAAVLVCVACIPTALGGLSVPEFGIGYEESIIPDGASNFLANQRVKGNVFNSYVYGNYLIFSRHPQNPVFIDGRVDMYGVEIIRHYDKLRQGKEWRERFREFDIHVCVLATVNSTETGLLDQLHRAEDWALVFWDDKSAVYVERAHFPEVVESVYVYSVRPDEFDPAVLKEPQRLRAAMRDYNQKLHEDPESAKAMYGLALCLSTLGQNEPAVDLLENALEISPNLVSVRFALARIFLMMNRLDEAEAQWQEVIDSGELQAESYVGLGVLYQKRGEIKSATIALERARRIAPESWRARWNLSQIYEQEGRLDEALEEAQEAIMLNAQIPGGAAAGARAGKQGQGKS